MFVQFGWNYLFNSSILSITRVDMVEQQNNCLVQIGCITNRGIKGLYSQYYIWGTAEKGGSSTREDTGQQKLSVYNTVGRDETKVGGKGVHMLTDV